MGKSHCLGDVLANSDVSIHFPNRQSLQIWEQKRIKEPTLITRITPRSMHKNGKGWKISIKIPPGQKPAQNLDNIALHSFKKSTANLARGVL
jgi:hypothetical protein